MPVKYVMTVELPGPGAVRAELFYDDFGAAMDARGKIMDGMTIRPVLSDPPGSIEAQDKGDDHDGSDQQ
jgi:hypothetical protein